MTRLPKPGADHGNWGDILNDFLQAEHNADGTHRPIVAPVRSVAGRTGNVTLAQSDIQNLTNDLVIRPTSRGTWQAQTAYAANDVVSGYGAAWRCKTAHTSSNVFQSQITSGFWEQWGQRQTWVNVMDPPYGAKVDGSNDDTAAVQAAIDAVAATGGGTVYVPAGFCMVRQLVLKNHVWLRGAGTFGTILKLLPNTNKHAIINFVSPDGSQPNAQYCGVLELTVDGNKASQSAGSYHGISLSTNPNNAIGGDPYFDPRHLLQHVRIYKTRGDGIHLDGRSDTRVISCIAQAVDGVGFDATFDTHFVSCIADGAGLQGFKVANGSVQIVNCKAFNSGQVTAASGAGFLISNLQGGVSLTDCYSQNNQAQGFAIIDSSRATLSGCVADSNNMSNANYAGIELDNAFYCTVQAICMQGEQGGSVVGHQETALRLTGGSDKNSVACTHSAVAPATVGQAISADSDYLDNLLVVDGVQLNPAPELTSRKGQPNGYAALDEDGLVPTDQLPASAGGGAQFGLGFFGDGSDGDATFDGTATFSWATKVGNLYKLNRLVNFKNITVASGVTVSANGYTLYASGVISGSGVIASNGTSATSSTGGFGAAGSVLQNGKAGGAGQSATAGTAGSSTTSAFGGAGGNGGNGSSSNGGAGGAVTPPTNTDGNMIVARQLPWACVGYALTGNAIRPMVPGAGGGGGGGDGTNPGGGGGGAGGVLIVNAKKITGTSLTFQANGGDGYSPLLGNSGGGGGGGGGLLIINTTITPTGISSEANGGSGGTGHGSGSTGTNGASGTVVTNVFG